MESYLATLNALAEDIVKCEVGLERYDDQFWRRAHVRAVFAYIEASVNMTRISAISLNKRVGDARTVGAPVPEDCEPLSAPEIDLLMEKTYRLNGKGDIEEQTYYGATAARLLFALKMYAKVVGHTELPDTGHHGYDAFKKAANIRDSVTHPRSIDSIQISDDDLETFNTGRVWFSDELKKVQDTSKETLATLHESLSQMNLVDDFPKGGS